MNTVVSRGDPRTLIALGCAVALAWAWLLAGNAMAMRPEWTLGYAALVFVVWVVMMVAMMLPGAAPAIVARAKAAPFAAAYLAVWTGFSLVATLAQFALKRSDLLSETMALSSEGLAGALILAVGVYQFTTWKQACLRSCASLSLAGNLHPGSAESARLGLRYGAFCLGCCWGLMVLLFVAGLMNLLWVAAIALWVSAEKLLPQGERAAQLAGVALIAWGSVRLALILL